MVVMRTKQTHLYSFLLLNNKFPKIEHLQTTSYYYLTVFVRSMAWHELVLCSGYHKAKI